VNSRVLPDPRFCAASIADPLAVPFSDEKLASIKARYIRIWRPEEQNALLAEAHGTFKGCVRTRENSLTNPSGVTDKWWCLTPDACLSGMGTGLRDGRAGI
jgi:hypothetical protein